MSATAVTPKAEVEQWLSQFDEALTRGDSAGVAIDKATAIVSPRSNRRRNHRSRDCTPPRSLRSAARS